MVVSHPEGVSSDVDIAVVKESTDDIDPRCAACLQRAFGAVALGEASPSVRADALDTIRDAEETWTCTARTRATIYRCKAEDCSHAVLSFTVTGTPAIPAASDLRLEPLPGTSACVLPPETNALSEAT